MFRPNRIGTPHFHQETGIGSAANFTWALRNFNDSSWGGNVVNGTPLLDFGFTSVNWSGTEQIVNAQRTGLFHNIVVTRPLNGDAVGIEIVGSLVIRLPSSSLVVPMIGKPNAAPVNNFDQFTFANQPVHFAPQRMESAVGTDMIIRHFAYKEQIVHQEADPSGSYCHGFQIFNTTGANYDVTWFSACFGVRQLNDQQIVGYRDSLR